MCMRDRSRGRQRETVIELVEEVVWGLQGALRLELKTNLMEQAIG